MTTPVDITFPEEWEDGQEAVAGDIEAAAAYVADYFSDAGYAVDDVWVQDRDGGASYAGRDQGTPIIKLAEDDRPVERFRHELGHDVNYQTVYADVREEAAPLVYYTFNEMVADLTAIHMTAEEGGDYAAAYDWGGMDETDDVRAWEDVRDCFDLEYREAVRDRVMEIEDAVASEEDWGAVWEATMELAAVGPAPGTGEDGSIVDGEYADHMFLDNMYRFGRELEGRYTLRSLAALIDHFENDRDWIESGHETPQQVVREVYDRRPSAEVFRAEGPTEAAIMSSMRGAFEEDDRLPWLWDQHDDGELAPIRLRREEVINEHALDILKDAFEDQLGEVRSDAWSAYRLARDADPVETVMEAIEDEKYGYKGGENLSSGEGYERYFDFPHDVGGLVAMDLHAEGITPLDVVEEPMQYTERCREALRARTGEWLDHVGAGED